eukprot:2380720-Pyramimonas_sp.AAC.1
MSSGHTTPSYHSIVHEMRAVQDASNRDEPATTIGEEGEPSEHLREIYLGTAGFKGAEVPASARTDCLHTTSEAPRQAPAAQYRR